jgi:hypothetical protein
VRRISLLKALGLGVVLFVALIAYHVLKQEYLVIGRVVSLDNSEQLLPAVERLLSVQWTGNLMELQGLATLMDGIPEHLDYQYGKTLLMTILIWVPSALFADKPLTAPGVFTNAFWPDQWALNGTTMPPGYIGEWFMNFGWVGIVIGALVAGHCYGSSMRRLVKNPSCDLTLGRHSMFIAVLLHFFRGEIASVVLLLISIYLPFRIICAIVSVRSASGLGLSAMYER